MNKFSRFIPLSKTDDEKRMVYGFASTPSLDSQGEIITADAIKAALPEYMKFPTIREMHQPKAAGVTKETSTSEKGLFIGAKIVDNDAWNKVKEGVYKGFSVGGRVVNKTDNTITNIDLTEISLVDRPANSDAVITVFKADAPMTDEQAKSVISKATDEFELEEMEISNTISLLRMASELTWIRWVRNEEGKSTKLVDKAIKALKQLAEKVLTGSDRKKFDDALTIKKSKEVMMSKLSSVDFAMPESRKLPIATKSQIIDSMVKFLGLSFSDTNQEASVRSRIIKAADEAGLETDGFIEIASTPMSVRKQKSVLKGLGHARENNEVLERINKVFEEVNMAKKSNPKKEEKVVETPVEETETKTEEKVEETPKVEETKAEEVKEETPETPAEPGDQVADPAKQAGDTPDFMKRLEALEKAATPKEEPVTKVDSNLSKVMDEAFSKVATALESLGKTNEALSKRVEALESQPAAPKTKPSYMVGKSFAGKSEEAVDPSLKADLDKVNKRLDELTEMAENDRPTYMAKYQNEAMSLLKKKSELQNKL